MPFADEDSSARGVLSPKPMITDESMNLAIQQFLDDWHYRVLQSSLGKKWSHAQLVKSALDVLQMNGMPLTTEDINVLKEMPEERMVEELVRKINTRFLRESFENVALQLQMLVTTTTRIRKCVDEGDETTIQEVMDEQTENGIGQQILKLAVINASKEISHLNQCQNTWKKSMDKRLSRLQSSTELARHAEQQLLAVEAQLGAFGAEQSGKTKKVLMGFAEGQGKALTQSCFGSWLGFTLMTKQDRAIREKYENELAVAEKRIFDFKKKQLDRVKDVLMRQAREGDAGLTSTCLRAWKKEIDTMKAEGDTKKNMDAVNDRLNKFKTDQKEKTKGVMARMGADKDTASVILTFGGWVKFTEDYKKDKVFEDSVKKAEQQFNEAMRKRKEDGKKVLNRLSFAGDASLIQTVWSKWNEFVYDSKKSSTLAKQMEETDCRLKEILDRQGDNAKNVQTRINEQVAENLLLKVMTSWIIDYKIAKQEKQFGKRMDGKRGQLQKVQTLFKSFAHQLEEGLGNVDGDSSGRTMSRRSKQGMTKGDGSVSLPDIHARPQHA